MKSRNLLLIVYPETGMSHQWPLQTELRTEIGLFLCYSVRDQMKHDGCSVGFSGASPAAWTC